MKDTLMNQLNRTGHLGAAFLIACLWISFNACSLVNAQDADAGAEKSDTLSEQLRKRLKELEIEDTDGDRDMSGPERVADDDDDARANADLGNLDLDVDLEPNNERPSTQVVGGRFVLPELAAVSTSTKEIGNGSTPDGFRSEAPRPLMMLPEQGSDRELDQTWNWSVIEWEAANTFSNPRYFEDRMLERHGHERWGHLQPLASGVRFFSTIPMLPYKMAIQNPCECEYTMGYFRSGSCAPMVYQRPPWDRKAILAESAAVASGMLIFP
ncbi:hypothetical protein N9N28_05365 [Rubripirellula amarantea]|uniref:Uncharacterized protein n=1 Tax=Rubripirellula amarantea TaxID=2527999 RepID=A0A5C5WTN0_9BACT|nr:hypothetical protein [Rubripirellula amarantea]MDA8744042.1 hypothetical protein [Rubripirellula amarantea]TWT54284.1 hypothetical protein Pla22_19260 [Rubripirellula amarantea]